ncbi:hypothetical protein MKUB_47570 [Mycobacterium kubicae]|uniref:GAP family protein n=1 Tax=Mycobacterium kubicae TaxID=120959 RepID=A0AAX1J879_9MYCO|nr:GAP family protein [Mycobacterium kubicae]MCV7096568.1 GAP family protein [Mycobacterium kubicae]ORW01801.1 hypothetical protein AWC13_06005 [Mycobacterium kubicae]QNI13224.1 GAP family protein [Mycobacterium kubicae]QPI36742.1 GAP family protein [Mycobacterium kubicae]GFG67267.1 hypothetical protein MKUB_47570 [Mycobacterium kubicae]
MWITILVMAVAVSLEPFRIGMTALLLNRPRPMLQLLAFLCGGFAMGIGVGLAILFVFRQWLDKGPLDTHQLSLPRVQILIGGLAVLVAAVLALRTVLGRHSPSDEERRTQPPKVARWAQQLVQGGSLWVAAVAGLGIALPSVDYLAALAVILASGATATKQVAALVLFNVAAFALLEIPLLAYLFAPNKTHTAVQALNDWIRSRRRIEVATLLAGVGAVLLAVGLAGLC